MIRLYEQAREAAQERYQTCTASDQELSPLAHQITDAAIFKTLELVEQEVRRRAEAIDKPTYFGEDADQDCWAAEKLRELADVLRHQREAK